MKWRAGSLFLVLVLVVMVCSQAQELTSGVPVCGRIAGSAFANYTINIDPWVSAASFSLSWKKAGSNLELALFSPGGRLLHPGQGSSLSHVSGQNSESYIVMKPDAGVWRAEVKSAGLPRDGEDEDYCLSAQLEGVAEHSKARFRGIFRDYGVDVTGDGIIDYPVLEVGVDVSVSGNYSIRGSLYDLKSGQEIQVSNDTYLHFGPRNINLNLLGMRSSGPYRIKYLDLYDNLTNKIDTSSANYTTKVYDIESMRIQSARLNGNYSDYGSDPNPDGRYNYLTVDAGLEVLNAGNYSLMGFLYDVNGSEAVWSTGYATLSPGNRIIHMDFDGKTLETHKSNGPYHLKELKLLTGDSDKDLTLEDTVEDAYITKPYSYSQFADPTWPENVLSGSGKGEILLTIMVKSTLPVFHERYSEDIVGVNMPPISSNWTVTGSKTGYSYDLPGVHMPNKPNNFTIEARGVKNLHVGVRKDPVKTGLNYSRVWVSAQATAGADGMATISNDMLSPGRYQFKVFGDAAENVSRVALEIKVVKKLVIDGNFKLALNMSGFPSGNYSFNAKALNGSLRLDEIEMGDSY